MLQLRLFDPFLTPLLLIQTTLLFLLKLLPLLSTFFFFAFKQRMAKTAETARYQKTTETKTYRKKGVQVVVTVGGEER